eukprot:TRINITY_DN6599_c0_g1_i2.p1 TRINITY_DN6599_c0_g1~~TRINITY_DN6599_c0_g1_i2.p1  ORF type:complete len:143 (-),score=51.34 TRINITY_DN6599_c0_g1_i2:11-400(-)
MAAKVDPEELKMWQILYPCYINANRTIQEGRRLPKEKACVNPSLQEIKEICDFLKVPCVLEPTKVYSRNTLLSGRARVLIKKDGKPVNPDIPSKNHLMRKLGELIPRLQEKRAAEEASKKSGGKKKKKK